MTFRYFPASNILCFQGWRKAGIHAPPGKRFTPGRGGGAVVEMVGAFELPTLVDATEEPSLNFHLSA